MENIEIGQVYRYKIIDEYKYAKIIDIIHNEVFYFYSKNENFDKIKIGSMSVELFELCSILLENYSKIETDQIDTCEHNWQKYQGFTETYDFCLKCDKKR